jgi:crossover junction endodeoxyribonuclease RusA
MGLDFRVYGTPAPQGSKRHVGNGIMVESSKRVKPWRQDVKHAALDALGHRPLATSDPHPLEGPLCVRVTFLLPRPRAHYGTGRNAAVLKPSAPTYHDKRPDLDKLLRSTLDALGEAGVWRDDSQVAEVQTVKRYTSDGAPGAHVVVQPA